MELNEPGVVIRRGTSDDFDDWNAIDAICFPALLRAPKAVPGGNLAARVDSKASRTIFQVAEIDGQVVGYAHTVPFGSPTARVGNLDMLAVLPEFRNRTVGTQLLGATLAVARRNGYDALVATIESKNSKFFEHSGWIVPPEATCLMWPRTGGGEAFYPDYQQGYDRVCYLQINVLLHNRVPIVARIAKEREYL